MDKPASRVDGRHTRWHRAMADTCRHDHAQTVKLVGSGSRVAGSDHDSRHAATVSVASSERPATDDCWRQQVIGAGQQVIGAGQQVIGAGQQVIGALVSVQHT